MIRAVTKPVAEHGSEWIACPGVRFNDGVPNVRPETQAPEMTGERLKASSYALLLLRRMCK